MQKGELNGLVLDAGSTVDRMNHINNRGRCQ
jgi:hypothetical protein